MATKVLIVEDDLLNRMFYEAVFRQRGYEMMLVDDGARVLDAVATFTPDIITKLHEVADNLIGESPMWLKPDLKYGKHACGNATLAVLDEWLGTF